MEAEPASGSARLRVVYLDHCAQLSGGELALVNLLSALPDVEAHIILAESGPIESRFRAAGATVEVLPMGERGRSLPRGQVHPLRVPARSLLDATRYSATLARRLRDIRPDLVHTNSLKAAVYGGFAARLARVPVVVHMRDRIAPDYLPAPAVALMRAFLRMVPSEIIANSQATLATLGHAQRRGYAIPSPVIHDPVHPSIQLRGWTRVGPLTVGMIGRIAPWKGQHVFIDAFAAAFAGTAVRGQIVGAPLFGEEAYEAQLRRQVVARGLEGQLELVGFVDGVADVLKGLDVLVHASVVPEPFGQVVIEGMAAGVPVVAADAGGPAEIITDGVCGLLFKPGDAEALAAKLRQLMADPELRSRLSTNAYARVEEFSPAPVAAQVMVVYNRMLKRRR